MPYMHNYVFNSPEELIEPYESRLLYDDEAHHGIMQKITEEKLDRILDFLKFRTAKSICPDPYRPGHRSIPFFKPEDPGTTGFPFF